MGVTPGETQDARKVAVSPGETIDARKTGFPRRRRILSVCMIIGLLLYKTGISANSQEVFSRAHGSLINPIKRHPCCFVCIRNPISTLLYKTFATLLYMNCL